MGSPLLVFLPGLDGTHFLLEPILREWDGDALTIPYPPCLPGDYAALLPIVLDALPKDRDFVLIGWSFSGPLALIVAATRPTRLRGVVLSASFVRKPIAWVPSLMRHVTWPLLFRFKGSVQIAKTALAGHGSPEIHSLIRQAHDAVPAKVMAARVRQVLVVQVENELMQCPVPILYLAAKSDRVVPRRNAALIQRLRPDVQVRTIPGPHIAMVIHAPEAAVELRRFVDSLPN